MRRIGIITFHRAINYGAALQTVATWRYFNHYSEVCEIVDYIPNNETNDNRSNIRKMLHLIKSCLFFRSAIQERMKYKKFIDFVQKNANISSYTLFGDKEAQEFSFDYDIMVSGSDQILNTSLTGNSQMYYLSFYSGKKISYASSFGKENIPKEEIDLIKKQLVKFEKISCREESAVNIVEEYIHKKADLVLDPCFLLSVDEWKKYEDRKNIVKGDYILVYAMEDSDALRKTINTYKLHNSNCKIYVIKGTKIKDIYGTKVLNGIGPSEFLKLIDNSKLVITNSFHGIVFSIIFQKKFISIAHSTRNTRISNVLSIIKCEDYLIDNQVGKNVLDCVIDGTAVSKCINEYVENSKKYIEDAIRE